jgi:phosphatidylcholine synthase
MKLVAFLIHGFTASGMIAVLLSLDAIWQGDAKLAMLWLWAALLIDGLDGPLARWAKVSERLPHIDGAILDHVIDYMSYCVLPAVMIYRFGLVPEGFELPIAGLILVASLYVFANRDLKTAENDFRGFPALWNIVVFYLIVFDTPDIFNAVLCGFLSLMIFAPILVVHPFRVVALRSYTVFASIVWLSLSLAYLLVPNLTQNLMANLGFAIASLYFAVLCLWRSLRLPLGKL